MTTYISPSEFTKDERIWLVSLPEAVASEIVRIQRIINDHAQQVYGSSVGPRFTHDDDLRDDETHTFSCSYRNGDGIDKRVFYALTDAGTSRRVTRGYSR